MKASLRKVMSWFFGLTARERYLLSAIMFCAIAYATIEVSTVVSDTLQNDEVRLVKRVRETSELERLLTRYQQLSQKLEKLESTYSQSQLSVDQVYAELDRVVKESVGGEYDLKRGAEETPLGERSLRQDFSLRIRSLTLEQLVKLLHRLEQGKAPLFLGRLEVTKTAQEGYFSTTIEVSTIQPRSA